VITHVSTVVMVSVRLMMCRGRAAASSDIVQLYQVSNRQR
jgi:hypothetical protein